MRPPLLPEKACRRLILQKKLSFWVFVATARRPLFSFFRVADNRRVVGFAGNLVDLVDAALRACWVPPPKDKARFAFKRDGERRLA
jgi:hypothetical protein